jgi:signal transduction histidine kinase
MRNSIQARLTLAFLGLAVGPLLIVGLILMAKAYSVQTQDAVALQREMAAHLSSQVQSLIRNLESQLQMLIRIQDLEKLEPVRRNLIFSIFHSRQSVIDDLILMDAGGAVLGYYSRLKLHQDAPTQPPKDLAALTLSISRGATYFGPVRFQARSGEPLMTLALPILALDTGKPEGGLLAEVRLKEVWNLVAEIRPGHKGASFIVDAENRVVAHSNPSVVLKATRFTPPGIDGVQPGLSGEKSVLVGQELRFGGQHFHIFVEASVSEAHSLAIQTVRIMVIIVLIAVLAACGLGFLMVRRIVRPVEDMARAARAINAGDLSRRVKVPSGDEVGVLASAFNTMTLQLEALINDLEKRVAERTAELEAANKELEAFAYSVSHDLRAPLRHINGYVELLQKRGGAALDDKSRHYMDTICDAAQKMSALIDDLLDFSRMGRRDLAFQRVDLEKLVREVIADLEPDAAGREIAWHIGELPRVGGDAAMLRIVLVNLIANAVKFTGPRETARIEIGSLPGRESDGDGGETVIYVRDNGVGFDMTYGDKLFGVFERLHSASEFPGTGIGLANVQRIVARHGGRTWAEGEVDQGASFYVALPRRGRAGEVEGEIRIGDEEVKKN